MSKLILSLLIAGFIQPCYSQHAQWVRNIHGQGYDEILDLEIDNTGNVFITGQIEFTTHFGGCSLNSAGIHDIFVAKYDPAGNVIWAKRAGGPGGDKGYSLTLDGSGNIFVTGEFEETAEFDGIQVSTTAANNLFIAKYDGAGNVLWVKTVETHSNSSRGYAINCDASGNVYISGTFEDKAYFDGNYLFDTEGETDIILLKLDTDGNFIWAKNMGGSDSDKGYGIEIEGGDLYMTGYFTDDADFSPSVSLNGNGANDFFIAKFDLSGNLIWAQNGGGNDDDKGYSVTVNSNGNIVCTGEFRDNASFGNSTLSSYGHGDMFVVAYDNMGNKIWVVQGGGVGEDLGRHIKHDNAGNLYVGGNYAGTSTYGSLQINGFGSGDASLISYDANGNTLFAKGYGSSQNDCGRSVAVDVNNNIYFSGEYWDQITFDNTTITAQMLFDGFIVKLGMTQPCAASANVVQDASCFNVCDGRASVSASGQAPFTYEWSTSPSQNTEIAVDLCAGTYTVSITDASGCIASSSVLINEPSQTNIILDTDDVSCSGASDGSAEVNASGNSPYTFIWNTSPAQYSNEATGLSGGIYNVLITDASGCVTSASVNVFEPSPLMINVSVEDATCMTCNNGSINIDVNGGIAPYDFEWSDGSNSEDRTTLGAGVYEICIEDDYGCTLCETVTINYQSTTGIETINSTSGIMNVFPNPASVSTVINFDGSLLIKNYSLSLYTISGVKLETKSQLDYSTTLQLDKLSSGIYYIQLTDNINGERFAIQPLYVR
jgi:hypothetical protein